MELNSFPKRKYIQGMTPIEPLEKISSSLGGANLYIKRDDLSGLTFGGNKTRKLEFLMGDAIAQGADTIVTCGAVQSNHCRLTLAAAIKEGMECHLILEERVPDSYNYHANGNNFLFNLMGAKSITVAPGGIDMLAEMNRLGKRLIGQGKRPYIIPVGGTNEIGSLGYIHCAHEIVTQEKMLGIQFDKIIVATGSGGTQAGLVVGMLREDRDIPIIGIGINRKKEVQIESVLADAQKTSNLLGINEEVSRERIIVYEDYIGEGYSLPTDAMIDAVKMMARKEAIILDPTYTGKAFSGLIDLVKTGAIGKGERVLFIHTGGVPAIYAHTSLFGT